jgi:hypothetical protein
MWLILSWIVLELKNKNSSILLKNRENNGWNSYKHCADVSCYYSNDNDRTQLNQKQKY